ncbi:hypothetical protein NX02_05330 [Sphingomonas sanxanigenens DSM 19645 = NX02]|uniref:Tyr recombinase domain-containing protein n=1 Tax=Sphingomonas sanxanigenens DSM 19645 = NX02 TaxID=1123269 RepID=W0AAV6_9SPHN|nr:hypothetical protein NX02_05330 [Sphingomonas sanxanigenens DSM 19645 = NX02]
MKGFGLKVTETGAKSYIYQYRIGGRGSPTRRYTIGQHGSPWTPTTARTEAERLARLVGQGFDVVAQRQENERKSVSLAMPAYVEAFITNYLTTQWKDEADGAATLRKHVVPVLKSKSFPSLTRSDITAVIDKIPAGQMATRRKVFAILRKMIRWGIGRGDMPQQDNPLVGFEAPPAPASRDRTLTDGELVLAWNAADDLGYPFGPMVRLLIALGQRREETSAMEWNELDAASGVWTIPAAKSKNGKAHIVPLNDVALAVIDGLAGCADSAKSANSANSARRWPKRGLLFSTTGKTPASGYSKAKARLDKLMVDAEAKRAKETGDSAELIDAWRLHDLRRTMATGLQRLGVRFEVTEAVLNHVGGSKAGVAGVYQRHDWKEEKRDALQAWGRFLEQLAAGEPEQSNVVHLAARG